MKYSSVRALGSSVTALALTAAAGLGLVGCSSVSQLNLIPVAQDPVLGAEAYPQLLEGERVITSGPEYRTVVTMTERLVDAALVVDPEIAEIFAWEVKLVNRDDLINAWCLPGGKMAVYTGILPVAADESGDFETGLAVVMGHEIAHATLRHGTRQMTRAMGAEALILGLVSVFLGGPGSDKAAIGAAAASLAANFTQLSFGRDAELEADRRGLTYMATAGYDPRAAVDFWQRMRAATGRKFPA